MDREVEFNRISHRLNVYADRAARFGRLPQHADEHGPERLVLLAVDLQLGEGAGSRVRGLTRLARSREAIEGY
jgi:hypothetical protein